MRLAAKLLIGCAAVIFVGVAAAWYGDRPSALALRILAPKAQTAIHDAHCADWSFTDTNVECAFEVAPSNFSALLSGHTFERQTVSGNSNKLGGGPEVQPEFDVAESYFAKPQNAPHGGAITVLTDKNHRFVRLSLSVE